MRQTYYFLLQGDNEDDEEYNEIVEDDRERFKDQLTCIGTFARQVRYKGDQSMLSNSIISPGECS